MGLLARYPYIDCIIGDLLEELEQRKSDNSFVTTIWYWRQAINVIFSVPAEYNPVNRQLNKLGILYLVVVLTFAFHLIGWMAYAGELDGYSSQFWQNFISGKVYLAFGELEFWRFAPNIWLQPFDSGVWFKAEPLLISIVLASVFVLTTPIKLVSFRHVFFKSLALIYLPAIVGQTYLAFFKYLPQLTDRC